MIDTFIVATYLLLTLMLGVWVAKGVTSSNEYKTGGRQYPAWIVFTTLSASFIGGGFTLGLAEKTFLYGFVYVLAIWGFSLKEILVAYFIAPRMQPFRSALTVGDIMEVAYGKRTKIATGFASVLVCGGIIGAQISACGNILNIFLGIPNHLGSLVAISVVLIYSTYGGLKSVVAVDILHFIVLSIMLPLVLFFGFQEIGGLAELSRALPESYFQPFGSIGTTALFVLFLSFFLGETLIPPYMQRLLIGKTVRETKKGTFWSGILSVPFFLVVGFIGVIAFVLAPDLPSYLALPHVIQVVMPVGLKGLAIAAMLAIVMSSADSFLNSTSIAMTNDLLLPLRLKPKNPNQELMFSRAITLVIGVVAIIFALSTSSALDILLYSYQFWTPIILVPLIAAIFGVKSTDKVFLLSAAASILAVIAWNYLFPHSLIDGALEGVIFGVLINAATFFIFHQRLGKGSARIAPVSSEAVSSTEIV